MIELPQQAYSAVRMMQEQDNQNLRHAHVCDLSHQTKPSINIQQLSPMWRRWSVSHFLRCDVKHRYMSEMTIGLHLDWTGSGQWQILLNGI